MYCSSVSLKGVCPLYYLVISGEMTDLFDVGDRLVSLDTALLHKELGRQLSLAVGLVLHAEAALCVGNNLALGLHHLGAHVLSLLLALLDELRLAGLALPLHPLERLVGGHVDTELLVVEIHGSLLRL